MNRLFLFLSFLLVAGCGSTGKSYYMLSASGPVPSGGGIGIGVGPVNIPEYLDRPNLVLQQAPNQLGVAEDHRWAGELSSSIARVTATNLGRAMGTGNVRTYPWQRDDEIRYQVTVDIRQFHADENGHAVIEAGWRVYSFPDRKLQASRTFTDSEPLGSDGYQEMVAAQSRLLERMSGQIAAALR